MHKPSSDTQLDRSVTLVQLTLFGTGSILGAGIYVLIGKVAGEAGIYTPMAFLLAAAIAAVTAFSYAEVSARYPRSAGEATYVLAAFQRPWLATLVGYAIVLTGIISSATLANGFVGYSQQLLPLPALPLIVIPVALIGLVAIWGIRQSMVAAAVVTLIEIGGLLLVIAVAKDSLLTLPTQWPNLVPAINQVNSLAIISGCTLAFYAFIGFEDMVNVAEEVVEPRKNLPKAILLAFFMATSLYVIVAVLAVLALPMQQLVASEAPFATLMEIYGYSPTLISLVSLIAIINGALVQVIMASRVLYGLARQGGAPSYLASVNLTTRTPVIATVLVTLIVAVLALLFPLASLAKMTSIIVLAVFVLVNVSLIKIKIDDDKSPESFAVPLFVPFGGALLSAALLLMAIFA